MAGSRFLEARDVTKLYGAKKALDGVSIKILPGSIHVLLGRNGSGKTTLAKVLAGMMSPDNGSVDFGGNNGSGNEWHKDRVGFLFDTSAHWETLTGAENAWFFARSFGLDAGLASERIRVLFDQLSLTDVAGHPVSTYSFGMKRKLELVEALVHEPDLLILDEPSIGLDYASRITIYTMLRARASRGLSIVVATNDMNEARYLADTVSLMDAGRILVTGTPGDLVASLEKEVLINVDLSVPVPTEAVGALPGVIGAAIAGGKGKTRLEVLASADHEQLVATELLRFLSERGIGFSRLDIQRPELGDVFLKYVGGART